MTHLHYMLDARGGREHRFSLALELDVHPQFGDLELYLPVWTPGSYLVREYQRHIGDVRATDVASGQPMAWGKSAKNRFRFRVAPTTRRVRVEYSVFAHELTVRTADLTEEHAFWNGACLFLWPVHEREAGATIDVILPDGWEAWSWLPQSPESHDGERLRFSVSGLDQLTDCPVLAAPDARVFEFEAMGRPHRFVFEGLAGAEPADDLVADTRAVILEAAKVFAVQALPYDRYDFLTLVTDKGQGGLEHADGSVLLASRTALATKRGYRDFMGLVAHEYFHVFNVKRMRPADLWRIDYEVENHTRLLWVAEGFTAYYDDLLCCRAGVLSVPSYLQVIADNIADAHRTPGRLVHSLADSSFDAWIKLYRPDEDTRNSSQSYYVNGSMAALCLDLEIRARTAGTHGLDDAMAALWRQTYERGRGYTHADVVAALSEAADADLEPTVNALVHGPFDPDFAAVLQPLGLSLLPVSPAGERRVHFGLQLQMGSTVVASVQRGGPAARDGVAAGDEILALDGLRTTGSTFDEVLRVVGRPGRSLPVLLARRGRVFERQVTPERIDGRAGYRIEVATDSTRKQDEMRKKWLGDRVKDSSSCAHRPRSSADRT